jgi:hypothetical protein
LLVGWQRFQESENTFHSVDVDVATDVVEADVQDAQDVLAEADVEAAVADVQDALDVLVEADVEADVQDALVRDVVRDARQRKLKKKNKCTNYHKLDNDVVSIIRG